LLQRQNRTYFHESYRTGRLILGLCGRLHSPISTSLHLCSRMELGRCIMAKLPATPSVARPRNVLLHAAARELLGYSEGGSDTEDATSRFMEWWAQPTGKEETPAMGACGGSGKDTDLCLCSQVRCERRETQPHEFWHARGVWLYHLLLACQTFGSSPPPLVHC
jgi:hypothetical protein